MDFTNFFRKPVKRASSVISKSTKSILRRMSLKIGLTRDLKRKSHYNCQHSVKIIRKHAQGICNPKTQGESPITKKPRKRRILSFLERLIPRKNNKRKRHHSRIDGSSMTPQDFVQKRAKYSELLNNSHTRRRYHTEILIDEEIPGKLQPRFFEQARYKPELKAIKLRNFRPSQQLPMTQGQKILGGNIVDSCHFAIKKYVPQQSNFLGPRHSDIADEAKLGIPLNACKRTEYEVKQESSVIRNNVTYPRFENRVRKLQPTDEADHMIQYQAAQEKPKKATELLDMKQQSPLWKPQTSLERAIAQMISPQEIEMQKALLATYEKRQGRKKEVGYSEGCSRMYEEAAFNEAINWDNFVGRSYTVKNSRKSQRKATFMDTESSKDRDIQAIDGSWRSDNSRQLPRTQGHRTRSHSRGNVRSSGYYSFKAH